MITGYIHRVQTVTGIVKKGNSITGVIDKPQEQVPIIEGDHQFVVVDLVKMREQMIEVNGVNAVVPYLLTNTQTTDMNTNICAVPVYTTMSQATITINTVPICTTVSQATATINEGGYDNVNE